MHDRRLSWSMHPALLTIFFTSLSWFWDKETLLRSSQLPVELLMLMFRLVVTLDYLSYPPGYCIAMNFETGTPNSTCEIGATYFLHENVSDPASELRTTVIFQSSVVIIGIIGVLANGLVIWVHFRSKPEKNRKSSNSLMLNQLFLDFCSCFFLIVTYVWKLANVKMEGILNVVLCFLIGSENLQWTCLDSSTTNLVFIALERYVKIVHPIWQRNCFRKWTMMTYISIVISWITGILINFPSTWISTDFQ